MNELSKHSRDDSAVEMTLIIKPDETVTKPQSISGTIRDVEIIDMLGQEEISKHNLFKRHRDSKKDEHEDMMANINTEHMELKHLRSSQNDPTSALILV